MGASHKNATKQVNTTLAINTPLLCSSKTLHTVHHIFIEPSGDESSNWSWTLFLEAAINSIMSSATTTIGTTNRANQERGPWQPYCQIITEPTNPKYSVSGILSFEVPSRFRFETRCSEQMTIITVMLQAWKNIKQIGSTWKTLQDKESLGWISNSLHDSTTSVTRITSWQAHWKVVSVLHIWRTVCLDLILKQHRSICMLEMTPAISRATINSLKSRWKVNDVQMFVSFSMFSRLWACYRYRRWCLTQF